MKMTIEEAITQLYSIDEDAESHLVGNKIDDEVFLKDQAACRMAISAFEKCIPKKIELSCIENGMIVELPFYRCSFCLKDVSKFSDSEYEYCPFCGQAWDWSDFMKQPRTISTAVRKWKGCD